jgi:hypothetical protein
MKEGFWTNERIHESLQEQGYKITLGHLVDITSGHRNASLHLRKAIALLVGKSSDNLDDLFPFVARVSASSIDGSGASCSMPPSQTDNGSNQPASHTVANNSQLGNIFS